MKKNKITTFKGFGKLTGGAKDGVHTVDVKLADGKSETVKAKKVVLATGSDARMLPGYQADETILTNYEILKIAEMPKPDRAMAERLHAVIKASAPALSSRLWYGMPAYSKDGNVICFFQDAAKFKARYATLGFSDKAHLDDGAMWPNSYALTELTAADEARIVELVKKAVS